MVSCLVLGQCCLHCRVKNLLYSLNETMIRQHEMKKSPEEILAALNYLNSKGYIK